MSQIEQYMSIMYGVRFNAQLIKTLAEDIHNNAYSDLDIPDQLAILERQVKLMELYLQEMKKEINLAKEC